MNPPTQYQPLLPLDPYFRRVVIGQLPTGSAPDLHHLQEVNGVWCVRASVDRGPKFVAERVKESLGGCPLPLRPDQRVILAQWMRDKMFSFAERCGVKFSPGNRLPNIAGYQRRRASK